MYKYISNVSGSTLFAQACLSNTDQEVDDDFMFYASFNNIVSHIKPVKGNTNERLCALKVLYI